MIILDAEDQRRSKQDLPVTGLTLRFPEKAVARSDSPLPDYETSEARQKFLLKIVSERKILDARLWRAILYAFVIYVLLSAVIGIPIVLLVRYILHLAQHPCLMSQLQKKSKSSPTYGDEPPPWDQNSSFGVSNTGLWSLGDTAGCNWTSTQEDTDHDIFMGRHVLVFGYNTTC
jgi:hypothetical protein